MKKILITAIISVGFSQNSISQNYFICYINDKNHNMQISICFDEATTKAKFIKYEEQNETIPLYFIREKYITKGSYPTIDDSYYEKFKGKITGTYKLTHSGTWDYVIYTRKKDGKKFNFTVNHGASIVNEAYRTTPCF